MISVSVLSEVPQLESERLVLRRIARADAVNLQSLAQSDPVYRYLPTFLYERKYADIDRVVDGLYTECLRGSLILGVFLRESDQFAGLAEMYGFREPIHKISIGYRLLEEFWGRGIATEAVERMTRYLLNDTDIKIITASTMLENKASSRVLAKNGFALVKGNVGEDWGYAEPTITDKWLLISRGHPAHYRFRP